MGKGSSILNGWKVSEFQKYCGENCHLQQQAEGLRAIFFVLVKRKSRRNGLFSKAGERLKYLWGTAFWLDLQVQIYLGANSAGISEVVPVYLQAEFAPTENRLFWQGHFITFRNDLNVEVILVDICFTSFYIICKHSSLQNWSYEPPSIGSHLNKWLDFFSSQEHCRQTGLSENCGHTTALVIELPISVNKNEVRWHWTFMWLAFRDLSMSSVMLWTV